MELPVLSSPHSRDGTAAYSGTIFEHYAEWLRMAQYVNFDSYLKGKALYQAYFSDPYLLLEDHKIAFGMEPGDQEAAQKRWNLARMYWEYYDAPVPLELMLPLEMASPTLGEARASGDWKQFVAAAMMYASSLGADDMDRGGWISFGYRTTRVFKGVAYSGIEIRGRFYPDDIRLPPGIGSPRNSFVGPFESYEDAMKTAVGQAGPVVQVAPGKWRSINGRYQIRALPRDVDHPRPHIHLEAMNPRSGQVTSNAHFFFTR